MENRIRRKRSQRIGEVNFSTYGKKMTIIEYYDARNIIVMFEDGYITKAEYAAFKKGQVRNPYDKNVLSVGYLGEGEYQANINNVTTQQYATWSHMLRRCYSEKYHKEKPSYIGCSVYEEWQNFQNFAKWYDENYYTIEGEVIALDKDIIHKDNKIYSPENCVFVPQNINSLFVKGNVTRKDLPIGVSLDKITNKYKAYCSNGKGISKKLGSFKTPEEAFNAYKQYKEKLIKQIADEYKDKIPQKLYDAMYKWEVEITD